MKVIGFVGQPCSGKSTLMRQLMSEIGDEWELVQEGLLRFHFNAQKNVMVMGIYDDRVFSGTDLLAKNVGPKFREWISAFDEQDTVIILWEGERFSNSPTIQHLLKTVDTELYLVEAPEEVLEERNRNRSNQNDNWRRSMKTRINNLVKRYSIKPLSEFDKDVIMKR